MRILVTGASGLVGRALRGYSENFKDYEFVFVGSKECDLRERNETFELFKNTNPDSVIHLAARVGGVKGNIDYVADFYSENIQINTNVLDASRVFGVKKVISLLSTCVYPDNATYPLTEDQIHNGPPHSSNFGYAYAKRMLDVQSRAYRQQYGCNFVTAIPNNLYGKWDNFDIENGHVIPSIVKKIYEANLTNSDVTLWGDGTPLREFTYSDDLAKILIFILENYNEAYPINIGNTKEVSIKYIAEKIAKILDFKGKIIWDTSKPKGQQRKPSKNDVLLGLGWDKNKYKNLDLGLKETCDWFVSNYPNIRGI